MASLLTLITVNAITTVPTTFLIMSAVVKVRIFKLKHLPVKLENICFLQGLCGMINSKIVILTIMLTVETDLTLMVQHLPDLQQQQ